MTPELISTLCDHVQGNLHALMNIAGELLAYGAERDARQIVRQRLEGICGAASLPLAGLDVQVITVPSLRLDLEADRNNLAETVATLRPRLLVLDPFVRLHRIDENASGDVRAGQALRGSSEFHAWGDSNLYLRRQAEELTLTVEHRAASSMPPVTLELAQRGDALALEVVDRHAPVASAPSSLDERITTTLAKADQPLPFADLRSRCRVRAATLYERLAALGADGRVVKTDDGYRLTNC